MIVIVDALNRAKHADLLAEMFRLRARVFAERLGWEVEIENGMEIDMFDRLDPAYVIGLNDEGHVVSCVRALQTTGPHMLSDVFSAILDGQPPLRSARVWESTRFCVDTARLTRTPGTGSIAHATCELMIASLEYARDSGISDIITVIDPVMNRVLKRSDTAPYGYLGKTVPMGKVHAMAALLDCTDERIDRLRRYAGIEGDVILSDDAAEELFARSSTEPAATDLLSQLEPERLREAGSRAAQPELIDYFRDQIDGARTPAEREDAINLMRSYLDRHPLAAAE